MVGVRSDVNTWNKEVRSVASKFTSITSAHINCSVLFPFLPVCLSVCLSVWRTVCPSSFSCLSVNQPFYHSLLLYVFLSAKPVWLVCLWLPIDMCMSQSALLSASFANLVYVYLSRVHGVNACFGRILHEVINVRIWRNWVCINYIYFPTRISTSRFARFSHGGQFSTLLRRWFNVRVIVLWIVLCIWRLLSINLFYPFFFVRAWFCMKLS